MGNKPSWYDELGYDFIVKCLSKLDDSPIVSIGSGTCGHEINLEKLINRKIICVDPEGKFSSDGPIKEERKPDFATAKDYLAANPDGSCHMLIIWPDPNFSTYDVEAIQLLKPKTITIVYESTGGSGGATLSTWLESIGGPKAGWDDNNAAKNLYPEIKYKIVDMLEKPFKTKSVLDSYNHAVVHLSQ